MSGSRAGSCCHHALYHAPRELVAAQKLLDEVESVPPQVHTALPTHTTLVERDGHFLAETIDALKRSKEKRVEQVREMTQQEWESHIQCLPANIKCGTITRGLAEALLERGSCGVCASCVARRARPTPVAATPLHAPMKKTIGGKKLRGKHASAPLQWIPQITEKPRAECHSKVLPRR